MSKTAIISVAIIAALALFGGYLFFSNTPYAPAVTSSPSPTDQSSLYSTVSPMSAETALSPSALSTASPNATATPITIP